jgi:isoquinoline 1-oxidoreductase subunit beta
VSAPAMVGRRSFIKAGAAIGGGLLVSWYGPHFGVGSDVAAAEGKDFMVNAFVRIGTDETVTVISAHSEMGQGVYTFGWKLRRWTKFIITPCFKCR